MTRSYDNDPYHRLPIHRFNPVPVYDSYWYPHVFCRAFFPSFLLFFPYDRHRLNDLTLKVLLGKKKQTNSEISTINKSVIT